MVAEGLLFFIQIYYIILFARIILSWFMMGGGSGSKPLADVYRVVYALTEPLLAPLRSVIPTVRLGMGYLDLSPIVLLILLRVAQSLIYRYIYF